MINKRKTYNEENPGAKEGEYKNVETSVNNPSNLDDSYESEKEDEITMEEPKTERDGSVEKS